jgi:hypothetical protein
MCLHPSLQIILAVAIQGRRPPIPMDCPPALRVLINACWRENPKARPSSKEVCRVNMLSQSSLEIWALWTPFYDQLRNLLYGTMLSNAGHPMVPARSDMQALSQ